MLNETAPPVIGQLILDELFRHLKLSSASDAHVFAEAESALRSAIAHIEAQLGLALVQRTFVWRARIGRKSGERIPMAPLSELVSAEVLHASGAIGPLDLATIQFDRSALRPYVTTSRNLTDPVALTFVAGFGETWSQTPADLRRACFMLAAHYFDNRHDVGDAGAMTPHGVTALIAPWRPLRLSGEASQ